MKNKSPKIFFKIFTYTMVLVLVICLTAALLFWRQLLSFLRAEQVRQLSASFQPMMEVITDTGKTPEDVKNIAREFANKNQSFRFKIQEENGNVIFTTGDLDEDGSKGLLNEVRVRLYTTVAVTGEQIPIDKIRFGVTRVIADKTLSDQIPGDQIPIEFLVSDQIPLDIVLREQRRDARTNYELIGFGAQIDFGVLVLRSLLGVSIMLAIAVLGAFVFAWKITKPLEDEIVREKAIEENQRLFFSAASHELKTPIAAERALVESMIAGVGDYKDHRKYLRECLKTLDSQSHLVSEILEIVKLSDAEAGNKNVSIDLEELGNAVLEEYRPLAEQRGLLINGEFKKARVQADGNLLRLVLSNVMANAVQNTASGGSVRVYTEEPQKARKEKKGLRLCVLNTGAQVPEEILPKLFDPFFRADTARTGQGRTGLGLAIVKKALDRMKFSFALENTAEGVLFWADLPV